VGAGGTCGRKASWPFPSGFFPRALPSVCALPAGSPLAPARLMNARKAAPKRSSSLQCGERAGGQRVAKEWPESAPSGQQEARQTRHGPWKTVYGENGLSRRRSIEKTVSGQKGINLRAARAASIIQ